MGSKNGLVGSVLWKICERATVQIITLITQIVLARIIAPEKFGSLSIIIVFYNIADIFVQRGFGSALIRKKDLTKDNVNAAFVISFAMATVLYAAFFFAAPFIAEFYNDPSLTAPLRVLMINLLISPFYCICNSVLVRNMDFKTIFIRGFFASLISGVSGIVFAYFGFGLWALVLQNVINQFVVTAIMLMDVKPKLGFRFKKEAFFEVFSFGKNVLITETMLTFIESLRSLIIGKVYTKADLAYYDRGQTYPATLMRAIYDTVFSTFLPFLSKAQDNRKAMAEKYGIMTHITAAVVVPVFLGLAAVTPEVIEILLTDKWSFAVPYMQIFCVYQALFVYQMTSKTVLYAIGNSETVLKTEIIKSVVSILLMIIAMQFGVIYIALSLIAVRLIANTLYLIAARKDVGKAGIIRKTLPAVIGSSVMFVSVYCFNIFSAIPILSLGAKILLGVFVYAVFMLLFDRKVLSYIKLFRRK